MKIFIGALMILIGALGLAMTACGMYFLPMQGIGLIGVIPGAIFIWAAWKIRQNVFGKQTEDPGAPPVIKDPE